MDDRSHAWEDMILVGVVARPHGLKGEVIVNLQTDFPEERFQVGSTVFREGPGAPVPHTVVGVRYHQGRPILRLSGVESIDGAEGLHGAELRVPAGDLGPLPPGQYYHHELVGCAVRTGTGEAVGTVTAVEGEGGTNRLVVRGGRGELLIPLADDICRVDVPARLITVTPPEGLLELNGDWRAAE